MMSSEKSLAMLRKSIFLVGILSLHSSLCVAAQDKHEWLHRCHKVFQKTILTENVSCRPDRRKVRDPVKTFLKTLSSRFPLSKLGLKVYRHAHCIGAPGVVHNLESRDLETWANAVIDHATSNPEHGSPYYPGNDRRLQHFTSVLFKVLRDPQKKTVVLALAGGPGCDLDWDRRFPKSSRTSEPASRSTNAFSMKPSQVLNCSKGHKLTQFSTDEDYSCYLCGKDFPQGTEMYGCRTCDWDICDNCSNLPSMSETSSHGSSSGDGGGHEGATSAKTPGSSFAAARRERAKDRREPKDKTGWSHNPTPRKSTPGKSAKSGRGARGW